MKFGVRYEQSWATACDPELTLAAAQADGELAAVAHISEIGIQT